VKEIYEKNKIIIWIVGGLTLAGFIAGMVLGLWDMVLALLGFGVAAPVLIQRHSRSEENQAQRIEKVASETDKQLKALYDEVAKKDNSIPAGTLEERKKKLMDGLDDV